MTKRKICDIITKKLRKKTGLIKELDMLLLLRIKTDQILSENSD